MASVNEISMELSRELARQGRIIAGGYAAFAQLAIPVDAPPVQIRQMQLAFFAGAQHLYATAMNAFSGEHEPTDEDLALMASVDHELCVFAQQFEAALAAARVKSS